MKRAFSTALGLAAALLVASTGISQAAEHVIKMVNKGSDGRLMVFEPEFVVAEPGDTLRIVPIDQGHSVETMPGMWPEGASPIKGKINQEVVIELEEGFYGLKCQPHFPLGMVAVVVVGEAPNMEQAMAARLPGGKPKAAFEKLFEQAAQL